MSDDPRSEQEPPEVYVKCLLCGEVVEAGWFDVHVAEECDIVGWEKL